MYLILIIVIYPFYKAIGISYFNKIHTFGKIIGIYFK